MGDKYIFMILILGAKGQLGCQLCLDLSKLKISFFPTDYDSLDITNDVLLEKVILFIKPSIIINAAAYTDTRSAEYENKELSYKINTLSIKNICQILDKVKIEPYIIHISTDYVFD